MRAFWLVVNERGEDCNHKHHKHIRMHRAVRCARSQERYYRRKYNDRQQWSAHRITFERLVLK